MNKNNISYLRKKFKNLKVIRSFELSVIAYELGLFNGYLEPESLNFVSNLKEKIFSGILWGLKLNGCSLKEQDIYDALIIEGFKKGEKQNSK